MRALRHFAFAVMLALAGLPAFAQDVLKVPPLSGRVIDQTGTLTSPQVSALTDKLAAIENQHGSQVVVLMVPTVQPEDIAAYAQRVGDTWKIGRRAVGDGLLIVVAKDDRQVRIEVAKALEGAVPDLAAKIIIDERLVPAFRTGDYAGGLNAGIDRLAERIGTEGLPEPSRADGASAQREGFDFGDLGIFIFLGVPVLSSVLRRLMGRKGAAVVTGGLVGGIGWWLTTSLVVAGGAALVAAVLVVMGVGASNLLWLLSSGRGGGGGFGGGGGGFGSGGGGDFGGGGASGRW